MTVSEILIDTIKSKNLVGLYDESCTMKFSKLNVQSISDNPHEIKLKRLYSIIKISDYDNYSNRKKQKKTTRFYRFELEDITKSNKDIPKDSIPYQNTKIAVSEGKSRIPLVLSAGIATTLITTSLVMFPSPFSYIIAIAIAGPLSASLFGLKRRN